MTSIKGLNVNTDCKAETMSSSSPLCCDGAPRQGERVLPSHGADESHSVSQKNSLLAYREQIYYHSLLQDKSLEKTFTLSMTFFFFKTDNKQKASHSKA